MANENVLHGIKCPKCGQEKHFFITGISEFSVYDDGTDGHKDIEWDDESYIRCAECNEAGKIKHFREPKPEKPFEVAGYVRKRYTTIVMATDKDDAVEKGQEFEGSVEDEWDEDYEYYDLSVENARELDPARIAEFEARREELQEKWKLQAERDALIEELEHLTKHTIEESFLDDLVHSLVGSEASDVNNQGIAGQVKFIYEKLGKNAKSEIRKRYVDE